MWHENREGTRCSFLLCPPHPHPPPTQPPLSAVPPLILLRYKHCAKTEGAGTKCNAICNMIWLKVNVIVQYKYEAEQGAMQWCGMRWREIQWPGLRCDSDSGMFVLRLASFQADNDGESAGDDECLKKKRCIEECQPVCHKVSSALRQKLHFISTTTHCTMNTAQWTSRHWSNNWWIKKEQMLTSVSPIAPPSGEKFTFFTQVFYTIHLTLWHTLYTIIRSQKA